MSTAKAAAKADKKSNVDQAMENIEGLTLLEMSELVKALEEKFGRHRAPRWSRCRWAPPRWCSPSAVEEKTEFDVILSNIGAEKIKVIKASAAITGLGLKEAKDLVEGAPKPIKKGVSKDEAAVYQETDRGSGGAVEVK